MTSYIPSSWDALHPMVVHFPIALLYIAPIFLVLAIIFARRSMAWLWPSAIIVVIGTAFAFVAVSTGEAAEEFAEGVVAAKAALEQHEEMAELVQVIFGILSVSILALATAFQFAPFLKGKTRLLKGALAIVLVGHLAGLGVLTEAAHQGGRLVHEFGIRARTGASQQTPKEFPQGGHNNRENYNDEDHDDD